MKVIYSDEELLNDTQIAQGTDYSALFVSYEDFISSAKENKIIRNCYFSIGALAINYIIFIIHSLLTLIFLLNMNII